MKRISLIVAALFTLLKLDAQSAKIEQLPSQEKLYAGDWLVQPVKTKAHSFPTRRSSDRKSVV